MHLPSNTGVYEPPRFRTGLGMPHPTSPVQLLHTGEACSCPHGTVHRELKPVCWYKAACVIVGGKSLQPKPQSQFLFCKTAIIHPLKDQIIRKCIKPHLESHDSTAGHSLMGALQKRSWTTCANLNHPTSGLSTFCSPLAVTSYNPTFSNKTFLTKTS